MFRTAGKWFSIAMLAAAAAACDESPVSLPEPTSIATAAAEIRLTAGDQATLPNQVLDQNGVPIRGLQASFVSDNPGVASVDGSGNVRAVSPGTATITASYGGATAATRVVVARDERGFARTVDVTADSLVTDVRAGAQPVAVRVFNGFGQQVCPQLSADVADRTVASVTQEGCRLVVTPLFPGRTRVTVSADGASDSFNVVVSSTGAVLFVTTRPGVGQTFAGNTVTYAVRLLDEAGNPLANRTVNFDVTAGRLNASSVTTDANGVATVQYTLPTNLTQLGANQQIRFRAQLPNGGTVQGTEDLTVTAAAPTSVTLYRGTSFFGGGGTFTPVTSGPISARVFDEVILGARGADQFGNPVNDFTFTVTAPGGRTCGDNRSFDNLTEYTCIRANSTGTATFTASAGGVSSSVQVTFTP